MAENRKSSGTLKVATYNIRKCVGLDWRRRPARILDVLRELGADVVALQEADKRFGTRAATLPLDELPDRIGMRAVRLDAETGKSGYHGNTILVRDGIQISGVIGLDLPSLEPRGAVVADLAVGSRPLRVVGAHLGLRAANRRRQVDALMKMLGTMAPRMPTMIVGDFNEWRRAGSVVSRLTAAFRPLASDPTFHASMPVAPLDRIIVGEGLVADRAHVHRSETAARASDHLPLFANVLLSEPS